MKIYVSHSRNFDFKNELYKPLEESGLQVDFIFPHKESGQSFDSKEMFEKHSCDYILAEVSIPSTGQGIELGWADVYKIPIICIFKKGAEPAKSLTQISMSIFEYGDDMDMVNRLSEVLKLNYA